MVTINELQVENLKRVKAVRLEPSASGLTVIGGRNGEKLKVKNFFKLYPEFRTGSIGFDVWEGNELWLGQDRMKQKKGV